MATLKLVELKKVLKNLAKKVKIQMEKTTPIFSTKELEQIEKKIPFFIANSLILNYQEDAIVNSAFSGDNFPEFDLTYYDVTDDKFPYQPKGIKLTPFYELDTYSHEIVGNITGLCTLSCGVQHLEESIKEYNKLSAELLTTICMEQFS